MCSRDLCLIEFQGKTYVSRDDIVILLYAMSADPGNRVARELLQNMAKAFDKLNKVTQ